MPQIAQIQITPWFHLYDCKVGDLLLKINDQVVIKVEGGAESGRVIGLIEVSANEIVGLEENLKPILRKVTTEDLNVMAEQKNYKAAALEYCRKAVAHHNLPMKVIDAHFSFDGGRLTFPFIADGRVDFRELVKDLTHHFQKSIRLQQIGIRDEAKITGDFGPCGRTLCCKAYLDLKNLGSVTAELAELQQISHRGSERLTGLCGRLRCCLAFEKTTYDELAKNLPAVGSKIKTPQGEGEVVALNILEQTVDVALSGDRGNIIEVPFQVKKYE